MSNLELLAGLIGATGIALALTVFLLLVCHVAHDPMRKRDEL